MRRSTRSGCQPTGGRSICSRTATTFGSCEPTVRKWQNSPCRRTPSDSSCRRRRKTPTLPSPARGREKLATLRPRNQLAPAVRADTIHSGRAVGTEGAFKAADPGLVGGWQVRPALFTRRTHLERHSSRPNALRPAESTTGALVGFFARGIDASGVVLVAFAAALRHLHGSLWITEALRGSDVARAPLIDRRHNYLHRFASVRPPHRPTS